MDMCEGPELPKDCPVDCLAKQTGGTPRMPTRAPNSRDVGPAVEPSLPYLDIMVHLEGWGDDRDQE